jgi:hypothetical protein
MYTNELRQRIKGRHKPNNNARALAAKKKYDKQKKTCQQRKSAVTNNEDSDDESVQECPYDHSDDKSYSQEMQAGKLFLFAVDYSEQTKLTSLMLPPIFFHRLLQERLFLTWQDVPGRMRWSV